MPSRAILLLLLSVEMSINLELGFRFTAGNEAPLTHTQLPIGIGR